MGVGEGRTVKLAPLYRCSQLCPNTNARAARRCSLPGFGPERWDPAADPDAAAEAEALLEDLAGVCKVDGLDLDLELDRDGCPWGWVASGYAQSVRSYMGKRSADNPVRSASLRLTRRMLRDEEEPREVLDAVELAEAFEDGAYARYHDTLRSQISSTK